MIYVDYNIHFFHPLDFLHDTLRKHRILLTPHWRTHWPSFDNQEYRYLFKHGLYNAAFIAASSAGSEIMDWWAECCLYARDKRSIEGEYIDQPILNLMPIYYEGVHVLKHKGCNLGVWNRGECPRVRQTDGNIQIDGQYPVVFIHFNTGIDPRTDYMLGAYYHQYLDTLKRYSETLWKREINQRKSGQDTYQENLPPWYRQLKKVFIRVLSAITFFRRKKQIVLLAHPGTSLQCLGLWLRTIPGTVVSGMPVKDWSDDPVDDMHHDLERITETPETLKRFQRSILNGERCDETRMHWENLGSLLRWRHTILSMPEGSLCWRELKDNMAAHTDVVALVSNPIQFALRMKVEESSEWATRQLKEAENHLVQNPMLFKWKDHHQDSFVKWVVKWCIDLKQMNILIRDGHSIHLLFDDELRNDTELALTQTCKRISLPNPDSVRHRLNQHCVFMDAHGRQIQGESCRHLMSDAQYETAQEVISAMGIRSLPGFQITKDFTKTFQMDADNKATAF